MTSAHDILKAMEKLRENMPRIVVKFWGSKLTLALMTYQMQLQHSSEFPKPPIGVLGTLNDIPFNVDNKVADFWVRAEFNDGTQELIDCRPKGAKP